MHQQLMCAAGTSTCGVLNLLHRPLHKLSTLAHTTQLLHTLEAKYPCFGRPLLCVTASIFAPHSAKRLLVLLVVAAGVLLVISAAACTNLKECRQMPCMQRTKYLLVLMCARYSCGRISTAKCKKIFASVAAHVSCSIQLCSTTSRTRLLYSRLFSLYRRAASELAGELGLGSHSRDCIDVRIADTS